MESKSVFNPLAPTQRELDETAFYTVKIIEMIEEYGCIQYLFEEPVGDAASEPLLS